MAHKLAQAYRHPASQSCQKGLASCNAPAHTPVGCASICMREPQGTCTACAACRAALSIQRSGCGLPRLTHLCWHKPSVAPVCLPCAERPYALCKRRQVGTGANAAIAIAFAERMRAPCKHWVPCKIRPALRLDATLHAGSCRNSMATIPTRRHRPVSLAGCLVGWLAGCGWDNSLFLMLREALC